MVTRFEKFSYFITELSRLLHKIESDVMEEIDLKGPHAIYLITISNFDEGITSASLAQYCGRDKADVSRSLRMLEDKKLIKKLQNTKNNYRAPIVLTDEGHAIADKIKSKAQAAVNFVSRGISEEERENLYKTLEIINSNIRDLSRLGVTQIAKKG